MRIGEVGDFGKLNCQPAQMYNSSQIFDCKTSAPITPNVCYWFVLLFCRVVCVGLVALLQTWLQLRLVRLANVTLNV